MELDQFMKELGVDFLEDVLILFFPDIAQRLDFSQKKDLNKQFYTDSPQGMERFVDVLIEVPVKDGPPAFILIHIESQQRNRFDFPIRMLGYHCLVYIREIESDRQENFTLTEFTTWQQQKEILSFVFCNYRLQAGITQQQVQKGSVSSHIGCQYTAISLPMLSAPTYLQKDRAVVCALAVFMNPEELSPAELKVACYRRLISFLPTLIPRQINLIVHAVETYLTLSDEDTQTYQRLIREIYPEVNDMITNPLIEQGVEQGTTTGFKQGMQESILQILSHRFSQLPSEIQSRVVALDDVDRLRHLLNAALEIDSLETLSKNGLLDGNTES
jgi:hypothetical protein